MKLAIIIQRNDHQVHNVVRYIRQVENRITTGRMKVFRIGGTRPEKCVGKAKPEWGYIHTQIRHTHTPRTVSRVFFLLVLLLFEIMKTTLTLSHI
jgi:hypothetical protein